MALPNVFRKLILDDLVTALEVLKTITPGVDYRHKLATVTTDPRTIEEVPTLQTPWALVVGDVGASTPKVTKCYNDEMTVTIQGYVWKDATRFPGLSAPDLLEEVMADCEKAIEVDPSRGGIAWFIRRERETFHDQAGKWSAFVLKEHVGYKRTS